MSAADELRFGPQRTLNLRESLPTAAEAIRRTESWLREQQVKGNKEVLIITGRGRQSVGGVPVLRGAIETLLFSLRRRGVIAAHGSHNPGAFVVELAPLRSLMEGAPRRRDRPKPPSVVHDLHGLSRETTALLHDLAQRALDSLGVSHDDVQISDEMHRQLRRIAPGLPAGAKMEEQLQATLRAAIAEYD